MKTCSCCGLEKSVDCFNKHIRMRDGLSTICKECGKQKCRERYLNNKERYKQNAAKWKSENKERYREASRKASAARYAADPEKHLQYSKTYREKHKDELLAKWREDQRKRREADPAKRLQIAREWARNNRPKVAVGEARRRARKRNRKTSWDTDLDELVAAEAFALREMRERATRITWHVDHIVPLQGKTVSGLHNAYNLSVIPAAINLRKKHFYWPNMP